MARIIITNNISHFAYLCKHSSEHGFIQNGIINKDNLNISTFSKLNFSSENLFSFGEDFVASAGTLIYKDKIGKECLKSIYKDFDGNINCIRKETSGSYVIVIKKNKKTYIFVDESGTYAYHYYLNNGVFIACNTYFHIQQVTESKFDKYAFWERIVEYCNIDNGTIYEDIKRVLGCEAIVINDDKIHIENIGNNIHCFNFNDEKSIIDEMVRLISKHVKRYLLLDNKSILFTTGGVDSRIILSIYNYFNAPFVIANWQGCPIDMNSKQQDQKIAKELAKISELPFIPYNVEHDYLNDCLNISSKIEKYGENGLIYCGNSKWYEIFELGGFNFFDFGYFGETIKEWEPLDRDFKNGFTIDDYSNLYLTRQVFKGQNEFFSSFLKRKIIKIANQYNMDITNLSKEDCMILYYVYRIHADTYCTNLANIFGYSANLFSEKEIADCINQIPYEMKKNDHLNLVLTDFFDSKLLTVDYFTHQKYKFFNREKTVLLSAAAPKHNGLKKWLRKTKLGQVLIRAKRILPSERKKYATSSLNIIAKTDFESLVEMKIDGTSFSNDVILFELPGWATLINMRAKP